MKITELLAAKQNDIFGARPVTIAFLGDSVTHGCFECYYKNDGNIETVFDAKSAYSVRLREILNIIYPNVQINIINSGISGDSAVGGLKRFDRDIRPFSPDLVVVSYSLNDCTGGEGKLEEYASSLHGIFEEIKKLGAEIIFLTQNYMNTSVSPHLTDPRLRKLAETFSEDYQRSGMLKKYIERAKEVCAKDGVPVCDLYPVWEKLENAGADTTELLANKLNHPIREYHYYAAMKLAEKIFSVD